MIPALAMLLAPLVVAPAVAQSEGEDYTVDVERFRPAQDPFGYSVTESAATLQHLQAGVGLWGNYSDDSVVMVWNGARVNGGARQGDGVLDQRSMVDLSFGIGLSRFCSLSVNTPFVAWQQGFEPVRPEGQNDELIPSGFSDIRIQPKFVLLDRDRGPVGLALLGNFTLPTGASRSFFGEMAPTAMPMAVFELSDGSIHKREYRVRLSVNAGYRFRAPAQFRDLILDDEWVYRAAVSIHPIKAMEWGADLSGAWGGPRSAHQPLEVLPWVKILPHPMVTVTAGGGFGLLPGLGSPDYRVFLGATLGPSFNPADRDSDGDGVMNDRDKCPFEQEDRDGFQDEDGCPDYDNDQDLVGDASDRCPNDPEDRDNFLDEDGCPDPDNDGDGLLDLADRCPLEGETVNQFQDEDGCPDEKPALDQDGDGYRDDVDRCPYDAEDFDSYRDEDGCPEPDNDADSVLDPDDRCPLEKEVFNGFEDTDGCPDEKVAEPPPPPVVERVIVERTRIRITETILFEYDRATIRPESFGLMDEIAKVILTNPQIRRIRVEGHTDDRGNDAYNLRLSQARADSVVNYLVAASVEKSRLDPVGFGEMRPLVANETEENRQGNRRVEFLIIEQD